MHKPHDLKRIHPLRLTVGLCDTISTSACSSQHTHSIFDLPLELILLLDSIRVGRTLGSVNQLLSQALSNAFDVSERCFPRADGQEGDSLVDPPQRGDIDSLSPDGTSRTYTCGVFTGSAVDNSINGNLDGVPVGHQVDNGEGVVDDADSLQLLAVVAAVHHQRVGKTLDDGALRLAESLGGITAGRVGEVDGRPDLHVIATRSKPSAQLHRKAIFLK